MFMKEEVGKGNRKDDKANVRPEAIQDDGKQEENKKAMLYLVCSNEKNTSEDMRTVGPAREHCTRQTPEKRGTTHPYSIHLLCNQTPAHNEKETETKHKNGSIGSPRPVEGSR